MKRKFSAFIVALSAIVLAVIVAGGCTFRNNTVSNGSQPYDRADSIVAAQSVTFETTEKTRSVTDALADAVASVRRTSVAIENSSGAGSGVIVDMSFDATDDTASWKHSENMVYIVTCHHMISLEGTYGAKPVGEITVYIPDADYSYDNEDYIFKGYIGNSAPSEYHDNYAITLVGGDFESDIAVLRLDLSVPAISGNLLSADKIEKAQIPDEDYSVRVGETVFSIGNPTGLLPGSVASGVVSYLERSAGISEIGTMRLMQIAVSTNPGNSGGGLYNIYGELIGITNAGSTEYSEINFAIPCNLSNGNGFVQIATQLAGTATDSNYGYVDGRKAKFGFGVTVYENDSSSVYVGSVSSDGIAYNKLQAGDKIAHVKITRNGEQVLSENVNSYDRFTSILGGLEVGDKLELDVYRIKYKTPFGGSVYDTETTSVSMTTEPFWFCNTGK